MAPIRTKDSNKNAEASSSNKKTSSPQQRKYQPKASAVPGKQKIKSLLRQARRLLAKDKLAADKRVETERRIKALEAELEQADQVNKERTLATRYHKVKFFERQKVMRKVKQTKKELESAAGSAKTKLEKQLLEERINLNYILHYPKTKKYVSLFPPEVREGVASETFSADAEKTNKAREEVREWVRGCMEKNELSVEPEHQLLPGQSRAKAPATSQYSVALETNTKGQKGSEPSLDDDIGADDFFENGSGEESGEGSDD
ncbi:hypothetical protein FA15DRAFT_559879, partial [Coprinopsis marcescibilis]